MADTSFQPRQQRPSVQELKALADDYEDARERLEEGIRRSYANGRSLRTIARLVHLSKSKVHSIVDAARKPESPDPLGAELADLRARLRDA